MKHLTSRFAVRLYLALLVCSASVSLLLASSFFRAAGKATASNAQKITVHAADRGRTFMHLRDGRAVETQYLGDQSSAEALRSGTAQARSLATADFDRNGTPDVVAGYSDNGYGVVTVQRGNTEAFAPNGDSVFVRIVQDSYNPDALLSTAQTYRTPEAADFLVTGDFNRDGKADVLVAARGGSIYLMAGDGAGNLLSPEKIELMGQVTALASGEFGRADGYEDVAVGIVGPNGPQVLVYNGAGGIFGEPVSFQLPSQATAVEFGALDTDPFMDLAVAAGSEIDLIHGWGRKNFSSVQSRVERLSVPFNVAGMTLGNFIWDRNDGTEIAAQAEDGTLNLIERSKLDTRPYTDEELAERRALRGRLIIKQSTDDIDNAPSWQPTAGSTWDAPKQLGVSVAVTYNHQTQESLFRSHIAAHGTDTLLALDAGQNRLDVVQQSDSQSVGVNREGNSSVAYEMSNASLDVTGAPAAVLELPAKVNGERSLVVVASGQSAPNIVPEVATSITVDRTDDTAAASACTASLNDCSLRGAVAFANIAANQPTTINIPAGTYVLNIDGTSEGASLAATCGNNSIGDLDINGNGTSLVGAGAASTIIRQSTANDRVICLNASVLANVSYSISGVTITGGREVDSASIGGGGLTGGAQGNNLTLTNVTFSNNQTRTSAGPGGGAWAITGGNVTMTGCTVGGSTLPTGSGDSQTDTTLGNFTAVSGGGISFTPGDPAGRTPSNGVLTVNGNGTQATTLIQKNKANSAAAGGGGADLFTHNLGTGSFHITDANITGNQATNGNGGGIIVESLKLTLDATSSHSTTITSNTAKSNGGGLYMSAGSVTIDGTVGGTLTFSGNTATNDSNGAGIGVNAAGTNTDCGASAIGLCAKGTLNLADNVEVQVNGAWTNNTGSNVTFANLSVVDGSFTANNSTITVNSNLNVAKNTLSGGTFNGNTSTVGISGNLNVLNGTFNAGTTVNLTGALNITTGTFNSIAQTGGTFSGGSSTVNIQGNFLFNAGAFTAGTSTFNFNGSSAQSIGTSTATFNNLTINNAAGVNMSGGVVVGGTLTLTSGVLDVSTNTLTLNSTVSFSSGSINSSATGTVNYNQLSNGQNVAPGNYGNLTFSNFTKTLPSGNTIKIAGTFTTGAAGGHTITGSTVEMNGTSAQTLPSGFTTYNNLTLNNAAGVTGFDGLTVNGLLRVQQGTFTALNTTANTVQIDSGATLAGTSAKTINVSGNWTNNGTYTANSNTVNFNGSSAQTIGGTSATTFNNLTINNANGVSLGNNVTVGGALTLTAGVLGVGTNTLTLNSTVSFTSGSITSSDTGTVNYNQGSNGQAVAPSTYGNLTFSNFNKTLPNSTITIAGTFTPGTATGHTITGNTINFNGTGAQAVPAFTYNNLTVSGTGRAITLANSGVIKIAGTFTPGSNNYTITGSTIEYNGSSAQSLPSGFTTYNNLTLNNTAGTTGFSGLTVNGLIEVKAGTFTSSSTYNNVQIDSGATLAATAASTINVSGNWTNNGTFTASTSTVNFNGSSAQTIGGTSATTFNNLTINNANGVNLGANVTVGGTLTLTSGVLGVSTNTLTLNSTVSFTSGSITSSATGTVNYNQGTNGQVVAPGNYGNLTFSNFSKVLPNGSTVGIAGIFTPGTGTGHTITGSTIDFNGAGAQTIPAFAYNNLTSSNTGARTLASTGTIGIAGTFTPGTNTYTITGSTIDFTSAGAQTVPAFTYNNLSSSGGGARTLDSSGTIKIAGTFTPGASSYTITGSTVEYNGSGSPQTLPSTFTTYNNLSLNNPAGTVGFAGLTVQGLLEVKSGTFTSSSTYNNVQIDAGATLAGTNATTINISGGWSNNGTFTPNSNTVNFNGASTQTIGGANQTTFNNLSINNSSGVTLGAHITVNGVLDLTGGDLSTSLFTLTMPATASSTGTGDVIGNVKRTGFVSGGSALSFGNPNNQITINSGTAPTDITVNLVKSVPTGTMGFPNAVQRTYTITPTGGSGISATLRLHYLDSELNGNTEGAGLNLWRFNGTAWSPQPITNFDTTNNWVEKSGITQFSPWTMNSTNAPTASSARISGRVVTDDGTPLGGVVVRLGGGSSARTITDAGGFYRFDNMAVNNLYTVVPERANYTFTPGNLSFSLIADRTDAVFTATADATQTTNPLETDMFFVRQHYLDFLGREPDQSGLMYWTSELDGCNGDAACLHNRMIDVSAAFFVEQEYQQTGSFVYRLYKAGLGRKVGYSEYAADRQKVVGGDALSQSQVAFSEELVGRDEFAQKYSGSQTAAQFVDALLANVKQSSGVDLSASRADYLSLYQSAGTMTQARASVLRAVIDSNEFRQAEYNNSFVLIEYFGYLRRDPDEGGYSFWLNVLNNRVPGNYRSMVCAFITSAEYQRRFSAVVTRSNSECSH